MVKSVAKPVSQKSKSSEYVEWDSKVSGLGLRVRSKQRTWIVQARVSGKSRKVTLGRIEELSKDEARQKARTVLLDWKQGAMPVDLSETVQEFGTRYLNECAGQWKPATLRAHKHNLRVDVFPHLGTRRVEDLDRSSVEAWYKSPNASTALRTRALAVLSGMLRHAEIVGLRAPGSNPCKGLRRRKSGFKAKYLTPQEWARLGSAMRSLEGDYTAPVTMIRFLALTGCRSSEARLLRWDWIEGKRAALPDAKAGPRTIWLGKPAREILASLPRTCEYVFAHKEGPIPDSTLYKVWCNARRVADLEDLRLHDLRHGFASTAIGAGESLRTVAGLLGHSDLETTAGYAHLAKAPVKAAAKRVGTYLDNTLNNRKRVGRPPKNQTPADEVLARYLAGKTHLVEFCKSEGINSKTFHKKLVKWHKDQRGTK
ncbi:hypothetical protein A9Q96_10090 [Rhodobacterales bacterium 52_120_T64]|nr:hypothetical protein A9Q96_10090 [Rhodobacterales bacterium 52_120_T64]